MLSLQILLGFDEETAAKTKIKYNQWDGQEHPLNDYVSNPTYVNDFKLFWRSERRSFNVGEIAINLVQMDRDKWLLTTIKEVTEELGVTNGQNWKGRELPDYKDLYGRLVLRYTKSGRGTVRWYETIMNDLEVYQILPEVYGGAEFPGYDEVRLSYQQLETILRIGKKDWLTALSNQKAVYLLTDKSNGKHYVGSATSEYGMLLSRWQTYIDNGHGGNKELRALVDDKGFDYIKKYFQYSILENYNRKVDDHYVLARESWWKETLQSRIFGYNDN